MGPQVRHRARGSRPGVLASGDVGNECWTTGTELRREPGGSGRNDDASSSCDRGGAGVTDDRMHGRERPSVQEDMKDFFRDQAFQRWDRREGPGPLE